MPFASGLDAPRGRPRWTAAIALLTIALTSAALLRPHTAHAQAATAKAIVGSVQIQRPGVDGNPGAFALLTALFLNRPEPLAENATLQDQDGLIGDSEESTVQLVCSNGATLMLSGEFDAFLRLGPVGNECTVYIRAGTAVATTQPGETTPETIPTVIQYGGVTLGARSTQFGATVLSPREAADVDVRGDAFVIEGEVEVEQTAAPGTDLMLRTGQLLTANSTQIVPIEAARFDALAATYAKVEVRTIPVAERAIVQQELQVAYQRALREPTNTEVQRSLVEVYRARGLSASPAATYQNFRLNRASQAAGAVQLEGAAIPAGGAQFNPAATPSPQLGR